MALIPITDDRVSAALAAIDGGDVPRLSNLLATHPELLTVRIAAPDEQLSAYSYRRTLLHFVAENPIRANTLPDNIVAVTTAILDAGAEVDAETLGERPHTTLAMVASGCVTRECGVQIPLIELLVARGADPSKALYAALAERESDAVEALLRLGAQPGFVEAAGLGRTDLLRKGADDADELQRRSAMYLASIHGQVGAVDNLIDLGVDVNTETHPFGTAAHWAAWYGHRRLLVRLLGCGADLDRKDSRYDADVIGWVEHAGNEELAALLREVKPFADAAGAIIRGDTETLRRLLADDPGLANQRVAGNPRPLLMVLADWPGHRPNAADSARILIDAGADVNARFEGPHRETPLHWAASSDDVELLEALLDAGADIEADGGVIGNGASRADGTPLADAVAFGQWNAARRLVERGAQSNIWQAAALGQLDIVEELADAADTDALTNAFWCACAGGQRDTAEFLLGRGADLNWVGYNDRTPRAAAADQGHAELVTWLDSLGAA